MAFPQFSWVTRSPREAGLPCHPGCVAADADAKRGNCAGGEVDLVASGEATSIHFCRGRAFFCFIFWFVGLFVCSVRFW